MSDVKSPRAFALYRELVGKANEAALHLGHYPFTDADNTWWDLTALEVEAFGIAPELHSALLLAYIRYTDMTGETDLEFAEFRREERAAFPEFFRCEAQESLELATGFMAAACGLPYAQSLVWMCRRSVQLVRSGLIDDSRAAPDWAFGAVAWPSTLREVEWPVNRYDEPFWL